MGAMAARIGSGIVAAGTLTYLIIDAVKDAVKD